MLSGLQRPVITQSTLVIGLSTRLNLFGRFSAGSARWAIGTPAFQPSDPPQFNWARSRALTSRTSINCLKNILIQATKNHK